MLLLISSCKKYNDGYAKVKCVSGKIGGVSMANVKMGGIAYDHNVSPARMQFGFATEVCKQTSLTMSVSYVPVDIINRRIALMSIDTISPATQQYDKGMCGMFIIVQLDQIAETYAPLTDDSTQDFVRVLALSKSKRHSTFELHGTFYKLREANPPFELSCNPYNVASRDTIHIDHLIIETVDR
ncbi:MAG: hypothetical protein RL660_2628 [Bacteroidota bacterium]|jgi:hypothetical protein